MQTNLLISTMPGLSLLYDALERLLDQPKTHSCELKQMVQQITREVYDDMVFISNPVKGR